MKALLIEKPGAICVTEVPEPTLRAGEVLLRIRRAGFCGTDLSTFRGLNPLAEYPRIPGHELAGTIEALGPGVPDDWRMGADVLVMPYSSCGNCAACRQGRTNCCRHNQTLGVQRDGGLCEFLAVPFEKILSAEGLSLVALAMVEPLTVGAHAVARGRVQAGETVVVLGCGAIGLGAVAGASERGARVVAVDLDRTKLEIARRAGAQETINTATESLHDRMAALTCGEGPEVIIEAIGAPATFRAAVEEVCFAGRVVYIGYAKAPVEYETRLFVQKELDILGSRNASAADFHAVIAMLQHGRFPLESVVTCSIPLIESPKAMRDWSEKPIDFTKIHVVIS